MIRDHQLALALCRREGKKVQVNIAQIKEVLRCLKDEVGCSQETYRMRHKRSGLATITYTKAWKYAPHEVLAWLGY